MEIKISVRHGQLSEETQAKITAKVEKLTRFFERLTSIDLTVNLERRDTPELTLRVSAEHKHDFLASDRSETMMASLDNVVEKMEQQLRRYKEKVQDRHRGSGSRQAAAANPPQPKGP